LSGCLEDFAGLAGRQQQWARAVRLLGAVERGVESLGAASLRAPGGNERQGLPVALPEEYQRTVDAARAALGEAAFAVAWAAGRGLSLEEAVALALEESPEDGPGKAAR
jgi:hypothetical protein